MRSTVSLEPITHRRAKWRNSLPWVWQSSLRVLKSFEPAEMVIGGIEQANFAKIVPALKVCASGLCAPFESPDGGVKARSIQFGGDTRSTHDLAERSSSRRRRA